MGFAPDVTEIDVIAAAEHDDVIVGGTQTGFGAIDANGVDVVVVAENLEPFGGGIDDQDVGQHVAVGVLAR